MFLLKTVCSVNTRLEGMIGGKENLTLARVGVVMQQQVINTQTQKNHERCKSVSDLRTSKLCASPSHTSPDSRQRSTCEGGRVGCRT